MKFILLNKKHIGGALIATTVLLSAACANIGNPSGGARDEDPPRFVSANPAPGSLNVSKNKITLQFDELVNVKDAQTKVVVSPPSVRPPRVASVGKKVTVTFDSLKTNSTYTIDFADAIEDNNEGNKLEGFSYTFSTGQQIDSLRIAGMVLNARDLEPRQGILVGVHEATDSAFTTRPLIRIARTNDKGEFIIRGLKEGNYRVFALEDKDNDLKYANGEEDIAYYPLVVTPTAERVEAQDTVFTPLGEVDTIVTRMRTRYLPNDILLRTFNSMERPQYLVKSERVDSTRVFLKFNAPATELPELSIVTPQGLDWSGYTLERSLKNDSLVYWLPRQLVGVDSLRLTARYLRTDSAGKLSAQLDTLKFYTVKPKAVKPKGVNKKNKVSAADSLARITFPITITAPKEINNSVNIEYPVPLTYLDSSAFHLQQMVDTVWRPVKGKFMLVPRDSVSPRHLELRYKWEYDTKYRVSVDTLAGEDIYGKVSLPANQEFTTKKADEYCSLRFNITGLDSIPAFVELLSSSDAIVATQKVENSRVTFRHITPGKYYARIIEDYNGNGLFDTGNYAMGLQPDLAYYYPKVVNLKKNWDKEESWDVFSTPIDLMKPNAVKKAKPAKKKNAKEESEVTEDEEEVFDPTANPFDPNQARNRKKQRL